MKINFYYSSFILRDIKDRDYRFKILNYVFKNLEKINYYLYINFTKLQLTYF